MDMTWPEDRTSYELRHQAITMVRELDADAAVLLEGTQWDGPRWQPAQGRLVVLIVTPTEDALTQLASSALALQVLADCVRAACHGAPWIVRWVTLDELIAGQASAACPLPVTGERRGAAPGTDEAEADDENVRAMFDVAAEAWDREGGPS